MAYSESLAERIRVVLDIKSISYKEKRMMGGLTFMVDDKMCVGILKDDLMARIDPALYDEALKRKGCRQMDFTGKPMRGFVLISPEGTDLEKDFHYWIDLALEFNPRARSSKKR
jgi:TfoX/Sxy family transcriptional regulator of competence genes